MFYCRRDHQKDHWREHKDVCRRFKKLASKGKGYRVLPSAEGFPGDGVTYADPGVPARAAVTFHYRLLFGNGVAFEDTWAGGQPVRAVLGRELLVRALEGALTELSVGERAEVLCKPSWVYDNDLWRGKQPEGIPPDLPLVLDVQLLAVGS